jgi:hypothetical protein
MKTDTDQSPENTGGKTKSEIIKPAIEVGKAKVEGEKVSDKEVNEAATSLGLTKVRADTIKKLRDIGVAAEQCGAIKVALGRVLVCDDRLDSLMDVVLDVAQNSDDSDQRVKAATAGTSIAQQISKNADLVYKMQSENLIRDGGEKRKFHAFGPEHVVIPVQHNVHVNLAEEPKT